MDVKEARYSSQQVQQSAAEDNLFEITNALNQSRLLYRVLDRNGRVVAARTTQMEWIISSRKEMEKNCSSWKLRWIRKCYGSFTTSLDPAVQIIDVCAYILSLLIGKSSRLQLRIIGWILLRAFDEGTGMFLRSAFEQTGLWNTAKLIIETQTGASWEWWPFQPTRHPLADSELSLEWYCVS